MLFGTLGDRPSGVILFSRSEFDFVLSRSQDNVDQLAKYAPKLFNTSRQIHAQFLHWVNLRAQVFHRNKIDARGSIRKPPNVISWTISLRKLRAAGDKDAGDVIKAWNQEASKTAAALWSQGAGAEECAGPHAS